MSYRTFNQFIVSCPLSYHTFHQFAVSTVLPHVQPVHCVRCATTRSTSSSCHMSYHKEGVGMRCRVNLYKGRVCIQSNGWAIVCSLYTLRVCCPTTRSTSLSCPLSSYKKVLESEVGLVNGKVMSVFRAMVGWMSVAAQWQRSRNTYFKRQQTRCFAVFTLRCRLVGLASTSRADDPGFESRLRRDFSVSSHTSNLKIGTPVATLPGAWWYRVSAGTG